MGRRRRNSRRSKARSRARSRAKASAKKRNTARKASGRKPSGAKSRSQARASARSRAQASAKKRVAARKAAGKKPSGAKSRSQAKADNRAKAQSMAKKRIAAKKVAPAKKAAPAKKTINKVSAKQFDSRRNETFNKQLKNIQAANKPLGNPAVMSADGTFNRPGPGGPEKEADYTSYKPGSFYNQSDTNLNMTNALRSTRNLVTTPARMLGINNQFTNKLIPKSNEAIQDARDQRGPRPTLARRKGGGGNRPGFVPTVHTDPVRAPEPILEPLAQAITEMSGTDAGGLTRIQNQAYSSTLSNNLAGLTGNFDFGPQSSQMAISQAPELQAGQSRGRKRVRRFGRGRGRGEGDSFRRGGRRIQQFTSSQLNI